jgi:hypothetical protein
MSLTGAVSLTKLLPCSVGQGRSVGRWPKSAFRDEWRRTAESWLKRGEKIWFTGERGTARERIAAGTWRSPQGEFWDLFVAIRAASAVVPTLLNVRFTGGPSWREQIMYRTERQTRKVSQEHALDLRIPKTNAARA